MGALNIDPALIDLDQPSRYLKAELESQGLTIIDATESLRAAHTAGEVDLYGRVDVHFGVNGHRHVADLLFPIITDMLETQDKHDIASYDQ